MAFRRATMDFFGEQDIVRRKTALLLIEFLIATAIIVILTYLVVMCYWRVCNLIANFYREEYQRPQILFRWWDPGLFAYVGGGTFLLVAGVSFIRMIQMTKPIEYIMSLVGATLVTHEVRHPPTNRFINVVEEMSIASGVPIPDTYVMTREEGINALAVGNSPTNAAIAVTAGAINMLTRDELQGVIAHEFSHIFNGDMRLNVRLIGILYGIDFIGFAGRQMFRALMASAENAPKGMDNVAALVSWIGVFITLPFLIISYTGVVLGGLVRAAISRQREYLADASAVQFTRNPSGIAEALKKIGGLIFGSEVTKSSASFVSHFFFATSSRSTLFDRISARTHPPLKRRIRKLDPQFDGEFQYVPTYYRVEQGSLESIDWLPKPAPETSQAAETGIKELILEPEEMLESISVPKAEHLVYVRTLMASLPPLLTQMVREASGAQSVMYSLLLDKTEGIRASQLDRLATNTAPEVFEKTQQVVAVMGQVRPEAKLPVTDMAISTLRNGLTRQGYEAFEENIKFLIEADKQEDLFEFVIKRAIQRHLEPLFFRNELTWAEYGNVAAYRDECILLLACLVQWGKVTTGMLPTGGTQELDRLGLTVDDVTSTDKKYDFPALEDALEKMSHAKLHVKKLILAACASCIAADKRVTMEEAEMFRGIADALGYPIPPIIVGELKLRRSTPKRNIVM